MKKRIGLAILAWFMTAGAPEAFPADSYRVVNVVNDFLAYHRAAVSADWSEKVSKWDSMLENRHPDFFQDALYRRKRGEDRERYKLNCIERFWKEISPRMDEITRLNGGMEEQIDGTMQEFRKHLSDFDPRTDFFVTISFSFRGKAVTVRDREVLAIGLEHLLDSEVGQIQITLAHELFHLYHFQSFSAGGGLYRSLWAEGLAAYASAVVAPGLRRSAYLGFPAEKMNRCYDLLPLLAADLKKNMGGNDHRLQRIYFGAEPNDTQVPPEAGYYVGFLIAENLSREYSLGELARMPADRVYGLVEKELTRLKNEKP